MKKKLCLTGLLILCIALLPYRPAQAQVKPNYLLPAICGVFIIGVSVWIGYSVYKACQKIAPPPPKPDDEEDPPPPPAAPVPTKGLAVPSQTLALDDQSGVLYWDCSTNNWTDPVSGTAVTSIMKTQIQSSVDLTNWSEEISLLGYCSDAGVLMVCSRIGSPVATNYLAFGTTNVLNLYPQDKEPRKFFRLAAP